MLDRRIAKTIRGARNDKMLAKELDFQQRIKAHLEEGKLAKTIEVTDEDEQAWIEEYNLLTWKPVIFAANVGEEDIADDGASNENVQKVKEYAKDFDAEVFVVCAQIEQELAELDDEPIERMIVSRTVEKYFSEELTVVSAANGREAVEQFFAGDCQIALLDIEMPGMNGLEAAEQIRKRDKNCSIIFLTAFDEFNYAKRAIAVRAMEYLLKPVEDQELVAVLEEAVRIAEEQETDREAGEKKSAEQISAERDCHEDTADTERSRIRLQAVAGNIQAFIEHNYMDDISLQTVAEAMNYSDAYFCKIFKQCFDKNFIVYLSEYRVARAKELLGDVLINVKDVSQKVGYRDSNYFAKVFKRIAGVTPTEYRMQVLKEAGER